VEDLRRLAATPALVVPFRPEESKLFQRVRDGEMPPEYSQGGALSKQEKDAIRSWIAGGAEVDQVYRSPGELAARVAVQEPPASEPAPVAPLMRLLRWAGRFHILVIHFPLALLLAAAVGELWCTWMRRRHPWVAVRFCVLLAAGGGVTAVGLGWLHADVGGYGAGSPPILALHRWLGTVAGLWTLAIAGASETDAHWGRRSWVFRALLWTGALLIGAVGHLGGTLVHGEAFFNW
jgi:hypothetical protein